MDAPLGAVSNFQGAIGYMKSAGNRNFSGVDGRTCIVCGLIVAMCAFLGGAMVSARAAGPVPQPSPAKTTLDGVFTDAEAARGKAAYNNSCSACHMEDLSGSGQALPLAGDAFMDIWEGQTMNDLMGLVEGTMPQDRPGSLEPNTALDIISYILQQNKFPAGSDELKNDPDALKNILITKKAQQAPSK